MTVFLPFTATGLGGTTTFAAKFKAGMEARGHRVTLDGSEGYDALLAIVQCPFRYLRHAKRHGKPVIQRLDGTYYWTVAGWTFPFRNAKAALTRHLFADATVYQSDYSRDAANRFLGAKRGREAVIYNGVDTALFSPRGPHNDLRERPGQTVLFTALAFRRENQILPLLAAVAAYRRRYDPDALLAIAGTFKGAAAAVPQRFAHLRHTKWLGRIENKALPAYERAADLFLSSELNPACPNNLIESLAAGLPVVAIANGAVAELVSNDEGRLVPSETLFWRKRRENPAVFAEAIHAAMRDRARLSANARRRAERDFGLDSMISSYTDILKASL